MIRIFNDYPLFSLIIPIYNCEKYLSKCLNSIINQKYANFEAILIDDGSTDNSLNICIKYQNMDDRIKVFHNTNHGVSYARNKGIDNSKGKYIFFVDADDYLYDDKSLLKIKENIEGKEDVIMFDYSIYDNKNITVNINKHERIKKICKTGIEFINEVLDYNPNFYWYTWRYVFKKELLTKYKIYFPEDVKYHEDMYFINKVLIKCSNVKTINNHVYCYVRNEDSITNNNNIILINNRIDILNKIIYETKLNNRIPEKVKTKLINNYLCTLIEIINELELLDKVERKTILNKLFNNKEILEDIKTQKFRFVVFSIKMFGINFTYFIIYLRKKILKLVR